MLHTGPQAQAILDRYLESARSRSEMAVQTIMSSQPKDAIVNGASLEFSALLAKPSNGHAVVDVARPFKAHVHANFLQQFADKSGVTGAYLRELAEVDAQWARDLSAHVLTEHARHALVGSRNLVRGIGGIDGQPGTVKAFLSDKFRRIDCRPGLAALIESSQEAGAFVSDATITDTRAAVKVLLPRVIDLGNGEHVVIGLAWSNSDFGRGAQSLALFVLRVWCLNGATMSHEVRQVHLGSRLSDDVSYSERTQRLDAAATSSAIRDASRELLSDARVLATADTLRAAASTTVNAKALLADARKRLGKTLADKIGEAYNGPDVEELPAGNTAWRWSNAISWVAKQTDTDPETRLDLERAAGDALRVA